MLLILSIPRRCVETLDLSPLQKLHDSSSFVHKCRSPGGFMGRVSITVDGYDDTPDPVHLIPDIRRYYAHADASGFPWFYYADLQFETLWHITLCLLQEVASAHTADPDAIMPTSIDPMELGNFILMQFTRLNTTVEDLYPEESQFRKREEIIFRRSEEISHYFLSALENGLTTTAQALRR